MTHLAGPSDPSKKQIPPADPALLARDQQLEALKAVAGRLAHDVNNSLVPILGYVSMAREDIEPGTSAANFVSAAENSARKTERAMESILLAVYPHRKFQPAPGSLKDLLENEVGALKQTLPPSPPVEFALNLEPCDMNMDAHQWQTLVQQLLRNACQALPQGGRVEINLSRRQIDATDAADLGIKPGPAALITFKDNGCGMSSDTLRRCVHPFYSTQPRSKAQGLGLTMVHSIARQHGGQMRIASDQASGTCVEIWAPLD